MTNEELYDLMKRGFDDLKGEFKELRQDVSTLKTDVAELKGRRLAIKEWIPIACSVGALIVAIFALLKA